MQKISTFLWFNDQAEEAVKFYLAIFKRSKILMVTHYGKAGAKVSGRPEGSVMTVIFQLAGQEFVALNGGPHFQFTEAISLLVNCRTQAEVDWFWTKLSAGGKKSCCGWLKDKFGVSWQVVPAFLDQMLKDADETKSERVMQAMLKMDKIDLKTLKQAYAQK